MLGRERQSKAERQREIDIVSDRQREIEMEMYI